MSTETCKKCNELCTPWVFNTEYEGHICQDCYEQFIKNNADNEYKHITLNKDENIYN